MVVYIITIFSIVLALCLFGFSIFLFIKMNDIQQAMIKKTDANRARIGRLIQELNVIHNKNREEREQNRSYPYIEQMYEEGEI